MSLATFNTQHGFVEALVRGFRSTFLKDSDYHHLSQCETLDDVKINLQETDYDQFLANETKISPAVIQDRSIDKLVAEFKFLRAQAVEPLATFLDYITHEYMIENVMLLLQGTLAHRDVTELIQQCHPLGLFKESTMRSIPTFEPSSKGYADLYQTVLVDTAVGKYFELYLQESSEQLSTASEMRNILEEVQIEILKNSLMKFYLEDFFQFCTQSLDSESAVVMGYLLKSRADRFAINITLNSFDSHLNDPSMVADRRRLYPSFGFMYPEGIAELANCSDEARLVSVLQKYVYYRPVCDVLQHQGMDDKSIDDLFYEQEVHMLELAFEGQMHFGPFYAYVKLKEQEVRNIVWICECILQHQRDKIHKFVPVFSESAPWRLQARAKRD